MLAFTVAYKSLITTVWLHSKKFNETLGEIKARWELIGSALF